MQAKNNNLITLLFFTQNEKTNEINEIQEI
jgi:hypothetical protein